jgi:hypothetical protein
LIEELRQRHAALLRLVGQQAVVDRLLELRVEQSEALLLERRERRTDRLLDLVERDRLAADPRASVALRAPCAFWTPSAPAPTSTAASSAITIARPHLSFMLPTSSVTSVRSVRIDRRRRCPRGADCDPPEG